jgi:hypothetical protein
LINKLSELSGISIDAKERASGAQLVKKLADVLGTRRDKFRNRPVLVIAVTDETASPAQTRSDEPVSVDDREL